MTQYIDKDALVAEIEKRIKETESIQPKFDQFWAGQISAFKGILKILDTLEVKETKNQEWSANDERNLNVVLSFIDDEYLRRWLKDVVHERYDEQQVKN